MFRALVLTLIVLAACSSQPVTPMFGGDDDERPRLVAVAPTLVPLSCTADSVQFCPTTGCTAASPGYARPAPITVQTPASGGAGGRFCSGQDCQAAYFRDQRTREGVSSAQIWTGDGWSRPEGTLEIPASRSRFRLTKPASDGVLVWSGVCQASGS